MPITGSMPRTSAPAAPVKPSSEIAWTAKLAPRVTTKMPIAPETTATTRTGQERGVHEVLGEEVGEHQCVVVDVVDVLVVGCADDDDAAAHAQDVDVRAVELR